MILQIFNFNIICNSVSNKDKYIKVHFFRSLWRYGPVDVNTNSGSLLTQTVRLNNASGKTPNMANIKLTSIFTISLTMNKSLIMRLHSLNISPDNEWRHLLRGKFSSRTSQPAQLQAGRSAPQTTRPSRPLCILSKTLHSLYIKYRLAGYRPLGCVCCAAVVFVPSVHAELRIGSYWDIPSEISLFTSQIL